MYSQSIEQIIVLQHQITRRRHKCTMKSQWPSDCQWVSVTDAAVLLLDAAVQKNYVLTVLAPSILNLGSVRNGFPTHQYSSQDQLNHTEHTINTRALWAVSSGLRSLRCVVKLEKINSNRDFESPLCSKSKRDCWVLLCYAYFDSLSSFFLLQNTPNSSHISLDFS